MRRVILFLLLPVAVLVLVSSQELWASDFYQICGVVYDRFGNPAILACCRLYGPPGSTLLETEYTNAQGDLTIHWHYWWEPGTYTLKISLDGWCTSYQFWWANDRDIVRDYELTTRCSSGCPYVYVWDGIDWTEDNNILPASEDTTRSELDVTDYYKMEQPLVAEDGEYRQ
ncbi:MAG: hypothetical protein ACE5OR_02080 [bacterium]